MAEQDAAEAFFLTPEESAEPEGVTGGRQRALSIIARRRFASPGERFRVHILHVSKTSSPPVLPVGDRFHR